jgi:hypothetical protein
MNRDRLVMWASAVLAMVSLACAGALMPRINQLRGELQLTANEQVMKNLPPDVALTQAAMGSFRGLAVDVLWFQANRLKEQGLYYDAMQKASLITRLQPRFPQVWQFHAWNMAYNISVATHTPPERWMWVQNGVKLLRNEGIPLNPNAVLLYKELSWIFIHKIGQFSDDMHWFYKRQLAAEWNTLLGAPPETSTEGVIAHFRPIAEAYEAYVNDHELSRSARAELDKLIASSPRLAHEFTPLLPLTLQQVDVQLRLIERQLPEDLAKQVQPLRKMIDAQLSQAEVDPVQRLLKDRPEVASTVRMLTELGFGKLDMSLLNRVAYLHARRGSVDLKLLGLRAAGELGSEEQAFQKWLDDTTPATADARQRVLAFVRARVLQDQMHMDPSWMLQLMEGGWYSTLARPDAEGQQLMTKVFGNEPPPQLPLDWRHPGAHGMYWATLGVRKNRGGAVAEYQDALNTDRQILMALQQLSFNGRIVFDPASGYYRQLPDARYIPAYEMSLVGTYARMPAKIKAETAAMVGFEAGHENFLISAIEAAYFAGENQLARRYYDKLRRLYLDKGETRTIRFMRPLDDFVKGELDRDESWTSMDEMRAVVSSLVGRAIDEGYATGRTADATRLLTVARRIYDNYQRQRDNLKAKNAQQSRMSLGPFDDLVGDMLAEYMIVPINPSVPVYAKARTWANAPIAVKQRVFDRIQPKLYAEASQMGLAAEIAYPPPPGMEEYRKAHPAIGPAAPAASPTPNQNAKTPADLKPQDVRR